MVANEKKKQCDCLCEGKEKVTGRTLACQRQNRALSLHDAVLLTCSTCVSI